MIHIVNLDRKEQLSFEGTLSEASGTSAFSFPLFHLLCQDFTTQHPFQGLWANQRIVIYDSSPPNLEGFLCLNASFNLSS